MFCASCFVLFPCGYRLYVYAAVWGSISSMLLSKKKAEVRYVRVPCQLLMPTPTRPFQSRPPLKLHHRPNPIFQHTHTQGIFFSTLISLDWGPRSVFVKFFQLYTKLSASSEILQHSNTPLNHSKRITFIFLSFRLNVVFFSGFLKTLELCSYYPPYV